MSQSPTIVSIARDRWNASADAHNQWADLGWDEREALINAAHGWQPIETAPRSGTTVLLCQDGEITTAAWMTAIEDNSGAWIIWRQVGPDAMAIRMPEPTHWMPLPAPPGTDGAKP